LFKELINYPFLKIDSSLIKNIDTHQESLDIAETIYTFASKLGMQTVAEFVSHKAIYDIVSQIGIDYSQGFYFGKPAPLLNQNTINLQ